MDEERGGGEMKIYLVEGVYKKRLLNGQENSCRSVYINHENAGKAVERLENRDDIEYARYTGLDIADDCGEIDICSCKNKMELQLVCERCGNRKAFE